MNDKDLKIAKAGLAQFAKFGMRKTTMQDVADAAGISRQTLYNRVPGKDELLRLVAQHYFHDSIQRCAEAVAGVETLEGALDLMIAHFAVEPWRTIKAMPEAEEIEMATHDVISKEVAEATSQKCALATKVMSRFCNADDGAAIADFLCAALSGIKSSAETEAHLRKLCATLKQSIICLVASSS